MIIISVIIHTSCKKHIACGLFWSVEQLYHMRRD